MGRTNTSWKPGESGNPRGRPKKSISEMLEKAIKKVQKDKDCTLLEHFVRRAYEDDRVLIAVMKKIIPDLKVLDVKEEFNPENLGVIRLPAKVPEGTPITMVEMRPPKSE